MSFFLNFSFHADLFHDIIDEKHECNCDLDVTCQCDFSMPRGRGAWIHGISEGDIFSKNVSHRVGQSRVHAANGRGIGLSQTMYSTPVGRVSSEGPYSSTPAIDKAAFDHLTDMVGQLGSRIGESIVAKLVSAGLVNTNTDSQANSPSLTQTPTCTEEFTHTKMMSPQVTVHMK